MDDWHSEQARARRGDPETSHEAAAAVTPGLRELQRIVENYAKGRGSEGFTDAQMEDELDQHGSTLRTRRSELTARNIVLDSGQRRTYGSPRRRVVWVHRDYVVNPPPICDPPRVLTAEERGQGLKHAVDLEAGARQMRSEGRTFFADQLRQAAEYIRSVAS